MQTHGARRRRDARALRHLARTLSEMEDPQVMHEFLRGILTPKERETVARRWQLVRLLARGATQRDIAERLGISLCKITRGSRELQHGPKAFAEVVCRSLERKRRNVQSET